MSLRQIHALLSGQRERSVLAAIAHEVGGDPEQPETVIAAAQSLREAVNRLRGYPGIPLDADGRSQPFELVGR